MKTKMSKRNFERKKYRKQICWLGGSTFLEVFQHFIVRDFNLHLTPIQMDSF